MADFSNNMATLSNYTPSLSEKLTSILARNWYGDTREGYAQANKLMNVLNMTPVGMATGMYDAGRDVGSGNYVQGAIGLGMAGLPIPAPAKKEIRQGIKAYHGSPHSFDKFSMDKIGTGEGAQAYGHGLYFAEGEGVANSYSNMRARPDQKFTADGVELKGLEKAIADDILMNSVHIAGVNARKNGPEWEAAYNNIKDKRISRGHMYEVNIDADPEQFLDWDKPLSEQPNALKAIDDKWGDPEIVIQQLGLDPKTATGGDFQSALSGGQSRSNNATAKMAEAGIPGIKYLDAGSRPNPTFSLDSLRGALRRAEAKNDHVEAAALKEEIRQQENPSRNYVVFDDKLVSIVKKYGIAGASAMLGYDLMANVDPAQAAELQSLEPK